MSRGECCFPCHVASPAGSTSQEEGSGGGAVTEKWCSRGGAGKLGPETLASVLHLSPAL